MVKPDQVARGLTAYAETELLPAMDGIEMYLAAAALSLLRARATDMLKKLAESKAASALGLVDADGMMDIDAAADALKEAVRKHGKLPLELSVLGSYKLAESDIEKIRDCIQNAE